MRSICVFPAIAALLAATALGQQKTATYFPAPGVWRHAQPPEVGMDPGKLQAAIDWALAHGNSWDFEKDQIPTFGVVLGPLPKTRAGTNGVIVRHGYVVAEFGDVKAKDPVYSVAKSFLSIVGSLAFSRSLIKSIDDPVGTYVRDGGYDSPHNAKITWKNHFQQESEWEGALWGKNADFVGEEQFGREKHEPRAIHDPGTYYEYNDVRINRLALSLARVFGASLPEELKKNIMDPIGASHEWTWHGYGEKSTVEINGRMVESVSGGTRWGGGLWIDSEDMARFGLLILNHGNWDGRQLVSAAWLKEAATPSAHGPDYGYLWWLNSQGKKWPSGPRSSFAAVGNGGNLIWIDPDDDIVLAWHWDGGARAEDGMIQRIRAAIVNP